MIDPFETNEKIKYTSNGFDCHSQIHNKTIRDKSDLETKFCRFQASRKWRGGGGGHDPIAPPFGPGRKKIHRLSEKLASLGIMGDQLRAPLKPLIYHSVVIFEGGSQLGPMTPVFRTAVRLLLAIWFPFFGQWIKRFSEIYNLFTIVLPDLQLLIFKK